MCNKRIVGLFVWSRDLWQSPCCSKYLNRKWVSAVKIAGIAVKTATIKELAHERRARAEGCGLETRRVPTICTRLISFTLLVTFYLNILSRTMVCVCWGGGGGVDDQLLFLDFSEIDLYLLHLTCGRELPVSAQLRVSYLKIHPQSKISPLELSLSGSKL